MYAYLVSNDAANVFEQTDMLYDARRIRCAHHIGQCKVTQRGKILHTQRSRQTDRQANRWTKKQKTKDGQGS